MATLDLTAPVEDLARQLVDIPSVSGDEREIADAIEASLVGLAHLEVTRDGDAIVARTLLGRAERVIIAGHMDTVPIKDNVPCRWEEDGAFLVGRGSVDMKTGLAVQLSLAAAVTEPTRDITWIFYDHEEVEATLSGLGRLIRNRPDLVVGDFAVLGEATQARIEGGCNGTIRVDIRIPGKTAHSARAWKGVNAVHAAFPVLAVLAAYRPATVNVDGLDYRESLNAVGIRGGIAGNMIPDECVITVNYRFAPSRTADDAIALVSDLVAGSGVGEHSISVTDRAEGCRPGLDSPLAQSLAATVAATGVGPASAKLGWTDVARFGAMGIPAVNYGPGNPELAHADDERCAVAEIRQCREGLLAWLTA